MLVKGIIDRIVFDYKDIYKQAIEDNLQSPSELPYFEGDFWPNVMEENIRDAENEEAQLKKEMEEKERMEAAAAASSQADADGDDGNGDGDTPGQDGKKGGKKKNQKKKKSAAQRKNNQKKNTTGGSGDLTQVNTYHHDF